MRRLVGFVGIQLGGGLLAFLAWALLSQVSASAFVLGSQALAVGMVASLPMTLGLGTIIPSYLRKSADRTLAVSARQMARLLVAVSAITGLAGAVLAFAGVGNIGIALAFAGLITVSSLLQQVARVRSRFGLMLIGSAYSAALPVVLTVASALIGEPMRAEGAVAAALLLLSLIVTAIVLVALRTDGPTVPFSSGLGAALATSAPLVPHLLAIAVLMQGLRLPPALTNFGALAGGANVIMLFLGITFSVISALTSLLSADVQSVAEVSLVGTMERNARLLAVVGAIASVGVIIAYRLFGPLLFSGAPVLGLTELGLMALVPPLLCFYFFSTSILLRRKRTYLIAFVSVPVAIAYLLTAVGLIAWVDTLFLQLLAYALAIAVLALATNVLAVLSVGWASNFGLRRTGYFAGSILPATVAVIFGLAA